VSGRRGKGIDLGQGEVNFVEMGYFVCLDDTRSTGGSRLLCFSVPDEVRADAGVALRQFLDEIWAGALKREEEVYEICKDELAKHGIDLDSLAASRGLRDQSNLSSQQLQDLEIKDKGDLAEAVGFILERDHRGVPRQDIFAPNLGRKLMAGYSQAGIDGVAFLLSEDEGIAIGPNEMLVLCEWTHTSDLESIVAPCKHAADFMRRASLERMYQELRRVRRLYLDRGQRKRGNKIMLFLPLVGRKDGRVLFASVIMHDSRVSRETCGGEFSKYALRPVLNDPDLGFRADCIESTFFSVRDFESFYLQCYEGLRPYGNK